MSAPFARAYFHHQAIALRPGAHIEIEIGDFQTAEIKQRIKRATFNVERDGNLRRELEAPVIIAQPVKIDIVIAALGAVNPERRRGAGAVEINCRTMLFA